MFNRTNTSNIWQANFSKQANLNVGSINVFTAQHNASYQSNKANVYQSN